MSGHVPPPDLSVQRAELQSCDTLLTRLSQGNDPSYGSDSLLASLVSLRDEVQSSAERSTVPDVFELLGEDPIESDAAADADHGEQDSEDPEEDTRVVSLARHRRQKQRPQWRSTLTGTAIGAVAASALILVGGSAIYNAAPGSSLWGARLAVFGEPETQLVELTSTLEKADKLRNDGDIEGAKRLVAQARELIAYLDERDQEEARKHVEHANTVLISEKPEPLIIVTTTTTTETVSPRTTDSSEPNERTVTESYTVTETVTSTFAVTPEPSADGNANGDVYGPEPTEPTEQTEEPEVESPPREVAPEPAGPPGVNDAREVVSGLFQRGAQPRDADEAVEY